MTKAKFRGKLLKDMSILKNKVALEIKLSNKARGLPKGGPVTWTSTRQSINGNETHKVPVCLSQGCIVQALASIVRTVVALIFLPVFIKSAVMIFIILWKPKSVHTFMILH
jgi:hypothetical protein